MHRGLRKLIRLLTLASIPGLALFWAYWDPHMPAPLPEVRTGSSPDFILENYSATTFHENGSLHSRTRGRHFEYYNDKQQAYIQAPAINLYDIAGKPEWEIMAENGFFDDQRKEIVLLNSVRLHSVKQNVMVKAREITYSTALQLATSEHPIEIISPSGKLKAGSMIANLVSQDIEFSQGIEAHYDVQ